MKPVSFFKLVEIQTKLASVIPLFLGTLYALYRFEDFKLNNFLYMFISLLAFDMSTTAINNYFDYKKAKRKHGYNYETHNAIVKYNLKESTVIVTIATLVVTASIFGFLLYLNTSIIVLLIGMCSFLVGIIYSFGPLPIFRTPLGEMFSGFFMGFVIVFLSTFIHVSNKLVSLSLNNFVVNISFDIKECVFIFLFSIPTMLCIANIMLANNICDMEDDWENKRYTLPIYIGKPSALKLFRALYYISFLSIFISVILGIVPVFLVIVLLTILPINKNIKLFFELQTKKDTFALSVKNLLIINIPQVAMMGLGLIFG